MASQTSGRGWCITTSQCGLECDSFFSQLGLDVKTKETEEMTETVAVEEQVDEEQQISDEVSASTLIGSRAETPMLVETLEC